MMESMNRFKSIFVRGSGFQVLTQILNGSVKGRYRKFIDHLKEQDQEFGFRPSQIPSEDISPIGIRKKSRPNADSFISLPEKMNIISNKLKKPVTKNDKALLWLATHLLKGQTNLAFALLKVYSSKTMTDFEQSDKRVLSKHPQEKPVMHFCSKDWQINQSQAPTRPTLVDSVSGSQISTNTSAHLLVSVLHKIFKHSFQKSWNQLTGIIRYQFRTSEVSHKHKTSLKFEKLENDKKTFNRIQVFENDKSSYNPLKITDGLYQGFKNIKYQLGSPISRFKPEAFKDVKSILRNLCKASSAKLLICFRKLANLDGQHSTMVHMLSNSKIPTISDLKILKSLHVHWLSLMPNMNKSRSPAKNIDDIVKMVGILQTKITSIKRSGLDCISYRVTEKNARFLTSCLALEKLFMTKIKLAFRRLFSQERTVKFHRVHQKPAIGSRSLPRSQSHVMAPQRIALLAIYFGGEKLARLINKKRLSAFHTVRRHAAVETYRGFYSQWWRWKVANVQAKHHTQARAQLRELSEEKSLRMQSEERLTKWMSNTSCHAAESQANPIEGSKQGFYFLSKDIKLNTDREKRSGPKPFFDSKKLAKRTSVSSSIDSRRGKGVGSNIPQDYVNCLIKQPSGSSRTPHGKTSSLERSGQTFPFFPLEGVRGMFVKGNEQKQSQSNLIRFVNISDNYLVKKAPSNSLADHFKLKLKEPRGNLLNSHQSFKENQINLKDSQLEQLKSKVRVERLSRTTEESQRAASTAERLPTESQEAFKGIKRDSNFEFSHTSTYRAVTKTPLETIETPRTGEFLKTTSSRNPTLLELWTTRKLKNN